MQSADSQQSEASEPNLEANFITSVRQLTLEGLRAGEGYFNPAGDKLIFQSERVEGNPFFQMFVLDLETGDTTRVSPGIGKTTCGWFHPNSDKVMFASTQHDPQAKAKQLAKLKEREEGKEPRYEWDYDETYDLFSYDMKTKKYQQLTSEKGYDAEGSYSPDGKLIAFASNRNAYSKALTEKDAAIFEADKAYMMEIYVMNADGSNVRQLTDVPGYDGGPFFSPDGQRICWRRFDKDGRETAEILTMNIDGTDQRQITHMHCMSWAPYYHPSGKYLIFSTNKHGNPNFELYLVDVDGHSPPVRATFTDGFDGLASFSPDGNQIFWTSTRHNPGIRKGQIFRGDWNHAHALKLLGLDGTQNEDETAARITGANAAVETTIDFTARDIVRHVDYLCRKELGGRMTGSEGERKATAYVAAYLDNLGIVPDGDNGSWYQQFEFPAGAEMGKENRLVIDHDSNQSTAGLDADWRPLSFSRQGAIEATPIVFVGYGIQAQAEEDQIAYDSYANVDVTGKWVMMFRYSPDEVDDGRRQFLHYHSSLRKKAMVARDLGAVGIIVVSGPNSNVREQLVPLENDFSNSASSVAAISITDDLADSWLKSAGHDVKKLQSELDTGDLIAGFEFSDLQLSAAIDVKQKVGIGRNVVGRLQKSDSPAKQAIVIGAHIDHLGRGTGGSLARNEEKGQIHVGADDNASGVAAMLEVAEFLAGLKREGKLDMKRDVIFAAWSGEELGLHGSQHFVDDRFQQIRRSAELRIQNLEPYEGDPHDLKQLADYYDLCIERFDPKQYTTPDLELFQSNTNDMKVVIKLLASPVAGADGENSSDNQRQRIVDQLDRANQLLQRATGNMAKAQSEDSDGLAISATIPGSPELPVVACLNMDMVGRMQKHLVLQGLGSSNDWNSFIEKANVVVGLPVKLSEDTQLPTDASSFYRAGVPILSAFTGSHTDYHTPRDTPEKLNYPDAAKISQLIGLIGRQLAIAETTPGYVRQAAKSATQPARTGRRARLGSVPNYTERVVGVLLDDVSPDSPAELAGLARGDIIIELGGMKVEDINEYQFAIDALKVGKETSIVIKRGDQTLTLKIVPGSRD